MEAFCQIQRAGATVYTVVGILFFLDALRGSGGVKISPIRKPVLSKDTDATVTLPCHFTTGTTGTPRITWFRYRNGERRQIMRFEGNRLLSYGELLGRVARGDRGDLVLIRPSVDDSGKYSCEVEVERERPSWVKTDLSLQVRSTKIRMKQVSQIWIGRNSDPTVTLPCDYTIEGSAKPQITWRRVRDGVTEDMATFDKQGGLSVSEQFVGRVTRGDRGDLVLVSPTVEDSGTFTCVAHLDNENWVSSNVSLSFSSDKGDTEMIILLCILWIVPVLCGFIFTVKECDPARRLFDKQLFTLKGFTLPEYSITVLLVLCLIFSGTVCSTKALSSRDHTDYRWNGPPIVLGLCLMLSGTVCSAKALSSRDHTEYKTYQVIGLGTGISGAAIFISVYIATIIKKLRNRSCQKQNRLEKADRTDVEMKERTGLEDADDGKNDTLRTSTAADRQPEENALIPHTESTTPKTPTKTHEFRIINNVTNERITGMISKSKTDVYLITSNTLYHLDTSRRNTEPTFIKKYEFKEELVMVSLYRQGLLLLTNTEVKRNEKSWLMAVPLNDSAVKAINTDLDILCTFSDITNDYLYALFSGSRELYKTEFKMENIDSWENINTSVLSFPTYICKNSKGHLIVTDSDKSDVFVFDENSGFVTSMKISVPKDLQQQLYGCNRIAIDNDDIIYVTGPYSNYVLVFSADFRYERAIETGTETGGLISCLMIHDDSLYVSHGNCITVHPLSV